MLVLDQRAIDEAVAEANHLELTDVSQEVQAENMDGEATELLPIAIRVQFLPDLNPSVGA